MFTRRRFTQFCALSGLMAVSGAYGGAWGASPAANDTMAAPPEGGFSLGALIEAARMTAAKPYIPVTGVPLSEALVNMSADVADLVSLRPDKALFADRVGGVRIAPRLRSGMGRSSTLMIYKIDGDKAIPLACQATDFDFATVDPALFAGNAEFGGFDIRASMSEFNKYDNLIRFDRNDSLRMRAADGVFGMSARFIGHAIGDSAAEDIPMVRAVYISPPAARGHKIYFTIEGKSGAGVVTLEVPANLAQGINVLGTFFARNALSKFCIAPISAMVQADDDFTMGRRICTADGLRFTSSTGEVLWRPLRNHKKLSVTSFGDTMPASIALLLRQKQPDMFVDPTRDYARMPSYEIIPKDGFGAGRVVLTEIPTTSPRHDNIIAHWQPDTTIAAGTPFVFSYALRLFDDANDNAPIKVLYSRRASEGKQQRFVVHFGDVEYYKRTPQALVADVSTNLGKIVKSPELQFYDNGHRAAVSFTIDAGDASVLELRCRLQEGDATSARGVSEVWSYPCFMYDI